jgi:hypothetical protein
MADKKKRTKSESSGEAPSNLEGQSSAFVSPEHLLQGSLFSADFLLESITRLPDWGSIPYPTVSQVSVDLLEIFQRFPLVRAVNESQTEDDPIWPILSRVGWTACLRQQNLTPRAANANAAISEIMNFRATDSPYIAGRRGLGELDDRRIREGQGATGNRHLYVRVCGRNA